MVEYTSFSRLSMYQTCPRRYKYRYCDQMPMPPSYERPLLKGILVHNILEYRLNPENPLDLETAIVLTVPPWIENNCHLELSLKDQERVLRLALKLAYLLFRSSERATEDAIRNGDGSVPRDLLNYPPRGFTAELNRYNLKEEIHYWNSKVEQLNPELTRHNFVYLLAESLDLACHFRVPAYFERTLAVEMEISPPQGPYVPFPNRENQLVFNARIDWVVQDTEGRIYLIDHKTSRECPSEDKVANHVQLLAYAHLYEQATGTKADYIAINHLCSGNIVRSEISAQAMHRALAYLEDIQEAIEAGIFPRRHPYEYNSPCVSYDYRSKEIIGCCPYYNHCWSALPL